MEGWTMDVETMEVEAMEGDEMEVETMGWRRRMEVEEKARGDGGGVGGYDGGGDD